MGRDGGSIEQTNATGQSMLNLGIGRVLIDFSISWQNDCWKNPCCFTSYKKKPKDCAVLRVLTAKQYLAAAIQTTLRTCMDQRLWKQDLANSKIWHHLTFCVCLIKSSDATPSPPHIRQAIGDYFPKKYKILYDFDMVFFIFSKCALWMTPH